MSDHSLHPENIDPEPEELGSVSKITSVYEPDDDEPDVFYLRDEETEHIIREIWLDNETYTLLGKPDRITVTIEPGDTLNQPAPYEAPSLTTGDAR